MKNNTQSTPKSTDKQIATMQTLQRIEIIDYINELNMKFMSGSLFNASAKKLFEEVKILTK